MSKKAPACFAKSSGHVFNHPRREIELKESVLGSGGTWKLLMASLATTVDNTIKMADTVRKHGCQWCIRSILIFPFFFNFFPLTFISTLWRLPNTKKTMHTHTHTHTHAHAHTRTRAPAHTRTSAHAHQRTRAHEHTCTQHFQIQRLHNSLYFVPQPNPKQVRKLTYNFEDYVFGCLTWIIKSLLISLSSLPATSRFRNEWLFPPPFLRMDESLLTTVERAPGWFFTSGKR